MPSKQRTVDWGGLTLHYDRLQYSATPGAVGSSSLATGTITGARREIIADATTVTLTAAQSGGIIVLDLAAAAAFTLPTAEVGLWYEFVSTVTTHASTTIDCGTADFFIRSIIQHDVDSIASEVATLADGSADDRLTINGTTTGGLPGSWCRITAVTDTLWMVNGAFMQDGTVGDPFSAP